MPLKLFYFTEDTQLEESRKNLQTTEIYRQILDVDIFCSFCILFLFNWSFNCHELVVVLVIIHC